MCWVYVVANLRSMDLAVDFNPNDLLIINRLASIEHAATCDVLICTDGEGRVAGDIIIIAYTGATR